MRVQFGLILGSLLAVHAICANTQHERSRVAASAPRRLQHRQPLASLSLLRRAGPTLNPGDACQNPDQCLSGGCDNGVCDYSVVGKGCVMNSDCRQGTCQQGLCYFLPPSAACTADSQCVSNACTTGTCAPISGSAGASCLTGLDCPSLSCTNFVCDASTQGQPCNAASDCAVTIQGQGPCLYNRCFGFFNECTDRTMCFDGICRGSATEKYCYGRDSDPCDWNAQCSSQVCDAQDTGMCVGGPQVLTPPPAPTTSSTTSTPTSTSTSTSISTSTSSTTSTTSTTTSSTATSTTTSTTSSTSSAISTVSSTSTSSASTSKSSSRSSSSSSTTTMPTTTTTSSSSTTRTSTATTSTTSGLPTGASCTTNANCSTGYCRKALLSDGVTRASTGTCSVKRTDGSPCYQNGGCISGKCTNKVCAASTSTSTTSKPTSTTTQSSTKTTTTTTSATKLPSAATCTTNTQCKSQYCRKPLLGDGKTRAPTGTCQDKKASGTACYQNGGCISNKCVSSKCA